MKGAQIKKNALNPMYFISHMVQMKGNIRPMPAYPLELYIPHGSDESGIQI